MAGYTPPKFAGSKTNSLEEMASGCFVLGPGQEINSQAIDVFSSLRNVAPFGNDAAISTPQSSAPATHIPSRPIKSGDKSFEIMEPWPGAIYTLRYR